MFTPAAKPEDIVAFVKETAQLAGSNPCPPVVLGVGIGGDFELVAMLAKRPCAAACPSGTPTPSMPSWRKKCFKPSTRPAWDPRALGETTALAVNIEAYPTHIAGLPVAVNVGCHVHPPQDSGAVILISIQYIPLHIAIFWTMCYNEVREAGGFLSGGRRLPAFQI